MLLGGHARRAVLGDQLVEHLAAVPDVVLADVVQALELGQLALGAIDQIVVEELTGGSSGARGCRAWATAARTDSNSTALLMALTSRGDPPFAPPGGARSIKK